MQSLILTVLIVSIIMMIVNLSARLSCFLSRTPQFTHNSLNHFDQLCVQHRPRRSTSENRENLVTNIIGILSNLWGKSLRKQTVMWLDTITEMKIRQFVIPSFSSQTRSRLQNNNNAYSHIVFLLTAPLPWPKINPLSRIPHKCRTSALYCM
jgi:hypothetical protein